MLSDGVSNFIIDLFSLSKAAHPGFPDRAKSPHAYRRASRVDYFVMTS